MSILGKLSKALDRLAAARAALFFGDVGQHNGKPDYAPVDFPEAYNGREVGSVKITRAAVSDAVKEGLIDDLRELGFEYDPRQEYNVGLIHAKAGHRRADRMLHRCIKARADLVASAQALLRALDAVDLRGLQETLQEAIEIDAPREALRRVFDEGLGAHLERYSRARLAFETVLGRVSDLSDDNGWKQP